MALAYRTGSFVSAGNIAGPDLTLTKPTGTANGDVVLIVVYFEPDTCTISISPGTWETREVANTGAFKLKAFWKYASSEPASYTISNDVAGDQWRTAVGAAYSGGTGAGTLLDISSTNQADAQITSSLNAPSVTTAGADRLVALAFGDFSGDNPAAITGFCTNLRGSLGGVVVADALKATAGATGVSWPSGGAMGTEDFAAMHLALISDTPSGASVVISAGSPTWGFPHPPFRTA